MASDKAKLIQFKKALVDEIADREELLLQLNDFIDEYPNDASPNDLSSTKKEDKSQALQEFYTKKIQGIIKRKKEITPPEVAEHENANRLAWIAHREHVSDMLGLEHFVQVNRRAGVSLTDILPLSVAFSKEKLGNRLSVENLSMVAEPRYRQSKENLEHIFGYFLHFKRNGHSLEEIKRLVTEYSNTYLRVESSRVDEIFVTMEKVKKLVEETNDAALCIGPASELPKDPLKPTENQSSGELNQIQENLQELKIIV